MFVVFWARVLQLYIMKEHSRDVYGLWVCVRPPYVLWGCVGVPWACEDVCDCGLCVKTVELVRIITAYLQMHLPWFLPNAQTRWLLTTMITHTTRNIAATKYWIRPIFFKTDHALPSEAWMMMKCQWKYQNCRSLHHTLPPLMFMAFPNSPQQPSSKEKMLAGEREDSRRDISRSEDG